MHSIHFNRHNASEACQSYFTLIELLVVIAIIAILAAMLLPAMRSAIDTTKGLHCMNNLKQLHMPFRSYADDHNGFFMPFSRPNSYHSSNLSTLWSLSIERDYFKNANAGKYIAPKLGILICPSEKNKQVNHSGQSSHYGYTNTVNSTLGYELNENESRNLSRHREGNLKTPTRAFVIGDTNWDVNNASGVYSPGLWSAYFRIDILNNQGIRHRMGSNNLFYDGHTEWQRYGYFFNNPDFVHCLQ